MIISVSVVFVCEQLVVPDGEVVVGDERGRRGRGVGRPVRVQVAVTVAVAIAVVRDQQVCARTEYWTATGRTYESNFFLDLKKMNSKFFCVANFKSR